MSNHEQPSMMHYAMNFGLVVGVYYILKFCLFPMSLRSTAAGMLFIGLSLMVPLLLFRLTRTYRDRYMSGSITFVHALAFAMLTMIFGSLLASVAHYVYFAYIDGGMMVGALEQSIEQIVTLLSAENMSEGVDMPDVSIDEYITMLRTTMMQIEAMSPIDITMGMLSNNVSWSIIVALPVALFASLRKTKRENL
jgi:hypothetical protein